MERRAISGAELAKLERLAALGRELCARLAVHLAKVQHQARECQPLMRVTYIQEAEALESLLLASGLKQVYDTQYQTLRAGWRLGEDLVIVPPVVDQRPEPQPAPAQVQPTSVPTTPAASPAATTATSRAVKPSPEKVDSWASLRAKLDKGALLEARPPSSGDSLWPIGINSLQSASQLASKAPLYVRFKNFYYPVPQERWSEAYRIALLILMSKLTPEACVLCLQQNGFLMGSKVELYIKAPYRTPVLGVRPGLYLPIYNQPQQILANLRALSTALGKNPGDLSFYCLEAAASQPAPKAKTLPAAIAAANAANSTATTAKAGQGVVDVSNLDLSQTMISLGGGISVAPAAQPKTQSVPPARPTPPARSTLPTQSAPPIQSAPPAQAPPPGRSLPQVQPSPGAGGDPERELAEIMGLVGGYQGVMEEIKAPEKVESTTTARPKADLGSLRPTALGIGFDRVTVSPPTWPQLYVNFVRWLYEKKLASNVTALYRHEADWGIVVTASAAGMAKDHPGKAYIVLADCAYLLLESEPQRVVDTLSKCCRALGLRPQLYYAPREAAPQEGAWLLEEGLKIHLAPGLSPEEEPGVGEVKAAPPSGPRWLQIGGEGIEITPPSWAELLHRFVGWLLVHTSLGERPLEDLYNRCHLALTRSSAEMEGRYPGHKYVAIDSDLYLLLYEDQASVLDAIKACARYLGISFERIAISNHLPQPAPTPAAPVESSPPVDSVVDASIKEAEPEFETEPAMESEPVSEMASEVEAEPEVWPEVEPGLEPEPAPEAEPILEAKAAPTEAPLAQVAAADRQPFYLTPFNLVTDFEGYLPIAWECEGKFHLGEELSQPSWSAWQVSLVSQLLEELDPWRLVKLLERVEIPLKWRVDFWREASSEPHVVIGERVFVGREDYKWSIKAFRPLFKHLGIDLRQVKIYLYPASQIADYIADTTVGEIEPEVGLAEEVEAEVAPEAESDPVSEVAPEVETEPAPESEVWPAEDAEVEAEVAPAEEPEPESELGAQPAPTKASPVTEVRVEPAPEAVSELGAKPAPTKGPLALALGEGAQAFYGYEPAAWEWRGEGGRVELESAGWISWQLSLLRKLDFSCGPQRLEGALRAMGARLEEKGSEGEVEGVFEIGGYWWRLKEERGWSLQTFQRLFRELNLDPQLVTIYLTPEEVELEPAPAVEVVPAGEAEVGAEVESEPGPAEEVEIEPAAEVDPRLEPEPVSEAVNELEVQPGPTNGPLAPDAVHRLESQPAPEKGPLVREKLEPVRCRAASLGPLGEALRQVALEQSGGILMGDRLGYKKFLYKVRANYGGHAQQGALLALSEEGYRDLLVRCGLPLESAEGTSYYFYYPQLEKRLERILEEARQRDWRVFNLERLGARHNLEELNLRQVELWPSLLERLNLPGRLITKTTKGQKEYFYTLEPQERNLERLLLGEVRAHWGGESLLTLPQLQERLPYLGEADIKLAIGRGEELVLNETSTASRCASYLNLNYFELPPEEVERMVRIIEEGLDKEGSFTLSSLPLEEWHYLNDSRLTEMAWINGLYFKYLADKYQRKGSSAFINRFGQDTISGMDMMRQLCKDLGDERISLNSLFNIASEVLNVPSTKGYARDLALTYAYQNLVRIDEEYFVRQEALAFLEKEIDAAIEIYVPDCTGLGDIPETLLYTLPSCGFPWNAYLLGSYCYRFSKLYRVMLPPGQVWRSRGIGIIVNRNSKGTYEDLVARVLKRNGLSSRDIDEVRDFLVRGCYFGRVSDEMLTTILRSLE